MLILLFWVHTKQVLKHTKFEVAMDSSFESLRERILKRAMSDPPGSAERGDKREDLVFNVLAKMKKEGRVLEFIKTPKFGYADIVEGIDFYLIIMRSERIVIPIQVTGIHLVEEHRKNHPLIPIIVVSEKDENMEEFVKNQILEIIRIY